MCVSVCVRACVCGCVFMRQPVVECFCDWKAAVRSVRSINVSFLGVAPACTWEHFQKLTPFCSIIRGQTDKYAMREVHGADYGSVMLLADERVLCTSRVSGRCPFSPCLQVWRGGPSWHGQRLLCTSAAPEGKTSYSSALFLTKRALCRISPFLRKPQPQPLPHVRNK